MTHADEPREDKLGPPQSKLSSALNATSEATVAAAAATVRLAGKAAETLKNENVQTALMLGLSIAAVMAKSRIPGGILAKKGIDLLSDVATGLSQPQTQNGSRAAAPPPTPSERVPSPSGAEFDFEDKPNLVRPRTDIFPTPHEPEVVILGVNEKHGDAINMAGYSFTLAIDNLGNVELLVNDQKSLKWPYEVGGSYVLTQLPPRSWHVLLDRRGPKLPIAVQRLGGASVQIRVDGDLPGWFPPIPGRAY